jgi:hypothetical protein
MGGVGLPGEKTVRAENTIPPEINPRRKMMADML